MMWNLSSSGTIVRCLAVGAVLASAILLAPATNAQEPVRLTMEGQETLDPKERISGDAAVGISFVVPDDQGGTGKKPKLDIGVVYAYFYEKPLGVLQTTMTTVDGRYFAEFETSASSIRKNAWAELTLKLKGGKPMSKSFLEDNYDRDREIAILVTDSGDPDNRIAKKSFPVRWGRPCATDEIRIRVNAEGADAYVVRFLENSNGKPKGALARCDEASEKSRFKFDYNCDMRIEDMQQLKALQVIRKRGSTYEKPIPIALDAFNKDAANDEECSAD